MTLRTDLRDNEEQASLHVAQHNEANAAILSLQNGSGGSGGGGGYASLIGFDYDGHPGTTNNPGDLMQQGGFWVAGYFDVQSSTDQGGINLSVNHTKPIVINDVNGAGILIYNTPDNAGLGNDQGIDISTWHHLNLIGAQGAPINLDTTAPGGTGTGTISLTTADPGRTLVEGNFQVVAPSSVQTNLVVQDSAVELYAAGSQALTLAHSGASDIDLTHTGDGDINLRQWGNGGINLSVGQSGTGEIRIETPGSITITGNQGPKVYTDPTYTVNINGSGEWGIVSLNTGKWGMTPGGGCISLAASQGVVLAYESQRSTVDQPNIMSGIQIAEIDYNAGGSLNNASIYVWNGNPNGHLLGRTGDLCIDHATPGLWQCTGWYVNNAWVKVGGAQLLTQTFVGGTSAAPNIIVPSWATMAEVTLIGGGGGGGGASQNSSGVAGMPGGGGGGAGHAFFFVTPCVGGASWPCVIWGNTGFAGGGVPYGSGVGGNPWSVSQYSPGRGWPGNAGTQTSLTIGSRTYVAAAGDAGVSPLPNQNNTSAQGGRYATTTGGYTGGTTVATERYTPIPGYGCWGVAPSDPSDPPGGGIQAMALPAGPTVGGGGGYFSGQIGGTGPVLGGAGGPAAQVYPATAIPPGNGFPTGANADDGKDATAYGCGGGGGGGTGLNGTGGRGGNGGPGAIIVTWRST